MSRIALVAAMLFVPAVLPAQLIDNCQAIVQQGTATAVRQAQVGKARKWMFGAARIEPSVSYAQSRLPARTICDLKAALEKSDFGRALDIYFGENRDPRLADWVVYIPKDGKAHQTMLHDGKTDGVVRSQRYVWAIVFAERPDSALGLFTGRKRYPATAPDIAFSRRVIKYEEDPFLHAMANVALTKVFSAATVTQKDVQDSTNFITMAELSADTTTSLYVGSARLGLMDNAQFVLSLYPNADRAFPGDLRSVYTNMVNSSSSRWEIGLATGASYNDRSQRVVKSTTTGGVDSTFVTPKFKTGVLLNLYLNVRRPQLPLAHGAFSLVMGTSVPTLMEDIFAGVGVLAWRGKGGFVFGGLWEKDVRFEATATSYEKREGKFLRPYFGLDLRL